MSERFKVQISKICEGESPPRVRIPPSPNFLLKNCGCGIRTPMRSISGFERERAESEGFLRKECNSLKQKPQTRLTRATKTIPPSPNFLLKNYGCECICLSNFARSFPVIARTNSPKQSSF